MPGRLLVSVRQFNQCRLTVGRAEKRNADRKPMNKACWNADGRITGYRGGRRTASGKMIAVDQIGGPRRPAGRRDDGVQTVLGDYRVDPLSPRQPAVLL